MGSHLLPDDPASYPDFPGLELSLVDGASVRMEFEDLVDFISTNSISVGDPSHFELQGGLFPVDTSIYTTSVPRMNYGYNLYDPSSLVDFSLFDGSQNVDGYIIDYIEWTIHNPEYLGYSPLQDGGGWGDYYYYYVSFDNVTFEVHGDLAGTGDPVPEPTTMLLFGTGLVGLVGSRLRKKKK